LGPPGLQLKFLAAPVNPAVCNKFDYDIVLIDNDYCTLRQHKLCFASGPPMASGGWGFCPQTPAINPHREYLASLLRGGIENVGV